jgi:cell division septation protein DedD
MNDSYSNADFTGIKKSSIYPVSSDENNQTSKGYILNLVALANARMAYKIDGYLAHAVSDTKSLEAGDKDCVANGCK